MFVGDATVGKSSIVKTFCSGPNGFSKTYVMTQGCEVLDKPWKFNNKPIEFQIIDTSGQGNFRDISSDMVSASQISRSFVVVFVYDITNQDSFNSLQAWLKTVRDSLKDKLFYGYVVANKSDISERIVVRPQDGAAFARSNRFEFVETSAVTSIQLTVNDTENLFKSIADGVVRRYEDRVRRVSSFN